MKLASSLVTLSLFLILRTATPTRADDPPWVTAARQRQAAVRTLSLTVNLDDPASQASGSTAEEAEHLREHPTRFLLSADKCRIEREHDRRDEGGSWHVAKQVLCYIGKNYRSLWTSDDDEPHGSMGTIQSQGLRSPDLLALFVAFRGPDPRYCLFPMDKLVATGKKLQLDGDTLDELVWQPETLETVHIFLDPKRAYVTRRICIDAPDETLARQIDVTYSVNDVCGWMPTSWQEDTYYHDDHTSSILRIASDIKLNEPVDDANFDLVFPLGTKVYDGIKRRPFLVQPNGEMVETHWDSDSPTAEQRAAEIMDKPPWKLVGFAALTLLAAAVLLRLMKRRRLAVRS